MPLYGCVATAVVGLTCGEVQKAEVSIDDSLLPQHQQGHLTCCGLCSGALHLPQKQQHLHCEKASVMTDIKIAMYSVCTECGAYRCSRNQKCGHL